MLLEVLFKEKLNQVRVFCKEKIREEMEHVEKMILLTDDIDEMVKYKGRYKKLRELVNEIDTPSFVEIDLSNPDFILFLDWGDKQYIEDILKS